MRVDLNELAKTIYPKPEDVVREGFGGSLPSRQVEGVLVEDTENGTAKVLLTGDTVLMGDGDPEATASDDAQTLAGEQYIEAPCSASAKAGDRVLVTIQDGVPIDATAIGWGDRVSTVASHAEEIATATNQHFWADSNGAHVSTTANDSEGERNILMNAYGILLRAYANYLAALTSSGVAFYDGLGNNASNIVASFGAASAQIGKTNSYHVVVDNNSIDFVDNSGNVAFSIDVSSYVASLLSSLETVKIGHSDTSGHALFEATNRTGLSSSNGNQSTLQSKYGSAWFATVATAALDNLVEIKLSTETASDYSSVTVHPTYVDLSPQNKLYIKNYAPLVEETKSATISSTSAGTNATGSFSIAKTGYTPVGFQWWWSTGTRQNFFSNYGCHIEGNTFYYRFCNVGSSAANGTLQVKVLYVRSELL